MRMEKEFVVHAPVEYVYDCLIDLRRSLHPAYKVTECYYDHLDSGGKCFILLERKRFFMKEKFWIKEEVIEAKRPFSLKVKSETVSTLETGLFELSEAEGGTRVNWFHEFKITDVFTWIVLKLMNQEKYFDQMASYLKEQIEQAYRENQDILFGLTMHQMPTETMHSIFQKEPRRNWVQYLALLLSILFFFVYSYVQNHLQILSLLVTVSAFGYFLSPKPTLAYFTSILVILNLIFS